MNNYYLFVFVLAVGWLLAGMVTKISNTACFKTFGKPVSETTDNSWSDRPPDKHLTDLLISFWAQVGHAGTWNDSDVAVWAVENSWDLNECFELSDALKEELAQIRPQVGDHL